MLTEAFGEKFGKYRSTSKSTASETSSGNEKTSAKTDSKMTYQVERPKSLGSTKDLLKEWLKNLVRSSNLEHGNSALQIFHL